MSRYLYHPAGDKSTVNREAAFTPKIKMETLLEDRMERENYSGLINAGRPGAAAAVADR